MILDPKLFRKYVHVLLTDRRLEFTAANDMEMAGDLRRTRVFYCDPMQSSRKGSLDNNHIELRYILPKEHDLKQLGLADQNSGLELFATVQASCFFIQGLLFTLTVGLTICEAD